MLWPVLVAGSLVAGEPVPALFAGGVHSHEGRGRHGHEFVHAVQLRLERVVLRADPPAVSFLTEQQVRYRYGRGWR
jgi:hypothetical protein